jgi:hypothetical protein
VLAPESALQALDDDPPPIEVHILAPQQRDLSDAQAVVINQREERPVAKPRNDAEERLQLRLREVAREVLELRGVAGQKGVEKSRVWVRTAPFSERAQSGRTMASGRGAIATGDRDGRQVVVGGGAWPVARGVRMARTIGAAAVGSAAGVHGFARGRSNRMTQFPPYAQLDDASTKSSSWSLAGDTSRPAKGRQRRCSPCRKVVPGPSRQSGR